ncbi:hypothetical protein L484_011943 [Morus notabilis]|uniref:Uncharacterized protein n=1 Tax=Morus notabilis TaxID=981085 RepID=W9R4C2_9ROSA|nr:hypothetical protein L484_011943 [Morus notabilis]
MALYSRWMPKDITLQKVDANAIICLSLEVAEPPYAQGEYKRHLLCSRWFLRPSYT